MTNIIIRVRHSSDTLSELCQDYGRNKSQCCPSGCFVCPFVHQTDSGSWTTEKYCTDVTPSDWEKILKNTKTKKV